MSHFARERNDLIRDLESPELQRLIELKRALRYPCDEWVNPDSDLWQGSAASEFRSRLLTQHVFLGTPLYLGTFDQSLIEALRAADYAIEPAPDGERFWDVRINGRQVSLKSTKAKKLNPNKLTISKLTEAAWIQDCRSARQRRDHTRALFEEYFAAVGRILQLRYFADRDDYELVEVPIGRLRPILDAPVASFEADGPSVGIPVGQEPSDMTVKLDRSDAKITLSNIRREVCVVHAVWRLGR